MRFQCRIGVGAVMPGAPPRPAAMRPVESPRIVARTTTAKRAAPRSRKWRVRGAIAGAALVAAAGCASLDSKDAKYWRIEPVFDVKHSMSSSQAYYTLGQTFDGSHEWGKAIDAYRKAIADDANNHEAYNALGVALAQNGRYSDAEITLRQAVALSPARTHVLNNLGYVLLLAGKPEDAVVALRMAVDRDGGNARATANLQEALTRVAVAHNGTAAPSAVLASTHMAPASTTLTQPAASDLATHTVAASDAPSGSDSAPTMRVGYAPEPAQPPSATAKTTLSGPATPAASSRPQEVVSRLEVSNGNGVTGMAARVGRWLATQGTHTDRLSNQPHFSQQQTVVQYRNGHEEAALRIARSLPASAKADSLPTQGLRSDVRVVLGRDWVRTAACLSQNSCQPGMNTLTAAANP